jgi:hypothetical protein
MLDLEMLAIVYAIQKWRHYDLGTALKTTTFSDHQNLEYFTKRVNLNRQQARWVEVLQEYYFVIIYWKGSCYKKQIYYLDVRCTPV